MQKCAETIFYKDSPGITPGTRAHWRCEEALSRIARFPAGKPRPCVLLTLPAYVVLGDYPTSTQTVVAGTTLRGTPYELLPELFKFFIVPVWPHPKAKEKIHVHSNPDWDNPKQWLFMYQFTSMQPILGLWPRGTPQRHSTVHLSRPTTPTLTPVYEYDEETISWMKEYSAERVAKWSQQCQDVEGFAERCEEQYRYSRFVQSNSTVASSDCMSIRSTPAHSRSSSPLPTIDEETRRRKHRGRRSVPLSRTASIMNALSRTASKSSMRSLSRKTSMKVPLTATDANIH